MENSIFKDTLDAMYDEEIEHPTQTDVNLFYMGFDPIQLTINKNPVSAYHQEDTNFVLVFVYPEEDHEGCDFYQEVISLCGDNDTYRTGPVYREDGTEIHGASGIYVRRYGSPEHEVFFKRLQQYSLLHSRMQSNDYRIAEDILQYVEAVIQEAAVPHDTVDIKHPKRYFSITIHDEEAVYTAHGIPVTETAYGMTVDSVLLYRIMETQQGRMAFPSVLSSYTLSVKLTVDGTAIETEKDSEDMVSYVVCHPDFESTCDEKGTLLFLFGKNATPVIPYNLEQLNQCIEQGLFMILIKNTDPNYNSGYIPFPYETHTVTE